MKTPCITYCGNVHPVLSFKDLEAYLRESTPKVQKAFGSKFPLGLWLPKSALDEALSPEGLKNLLMALDRLETRPISFNGFPMEVFHGTRVKENVYQPDWSASSRLEYTKDLARLGFELGVKDFSISSLSGGFRPDDHELKVERYIQHWLQWVEWARAFETKTGVRVALALEPEPFNTMEDQSDAIALWSRMRRQAVQSGLSEQDLQRYLGLCFDTCHFSVRYIPLLKAWDELAAVGLPVHKIQVSVAPRWQQSMGAVALERFFKWQEPVYLHQSFALVNGKREDFLDLDLARQFKADVEQWRTHFHVPIHYGHREDSTGAELIGFLQDLKQRKVDLPVLEVETYSFGSMGVQWGERESLEQSIAKEMTWLQEQMV